MSLYFKNTDKDIFLTEKDEKTYKNNNNCRFCENENVNEKIRDHCHLTGKYRGTPHNICKIIVTQKQTNFIPILFHNFSDYDCHLFFRKIIDTNNAKVKFDVIPKTNDEYISITYGCSRFIFSYRFLSVGLDGLVRALKNDDFNILKKEFPDKWHYLNKNLVYLYE